MPSEAHNVTESPAPRKRRRRKLRLFLLIGLGLVILVGVLAPTILGPIAAPIVERSINDQIKGTAAVDSLRLGWLGPQRLEVRLADPSGDPVADVAVRAEKSLLALAGGSRRLGIVRLTGDATIVRDASGQTNLQRAIEPRFPSPEPAGGGEPATLPDGLSASVVIDGVSVTYRDAALEDATGGQLTTVRMPDLRGSLDFDASGVSSIEIASPLLTGTTAADLSETGALQVDITITGLTDGNGTLTPASAEGAGSLVVRGPGIDAAIQGELAAGVISRTGESHIEIDTARLAALSPALAAAVSEQPGVEVVDLPTVSLLIDTLRVPLGSDLREAAATVRVETTEIRGTVAVQQGETPSPFTLRPLELTLSTPALGEAISLKGGSSATIGGESAGTFEIDLTAAGLLDESGGARAGMPESLAGQLRVDGFATPILQPFVAALNTALPEGARLDLPRDLGPELSVRLGATSVGEGGYDIDLSMTAAQANLSGAVAVRGQTISARDEGVTAEFASVASLMDRLLAPHGARVDRGARVTIEAPSFEFDLAKLGAPDGADLRGAGAVASVMVEQIAGSVQLEGHERPFAFLVDRLSVAIDSADLAQRIGVKSEAAAQIDGSPLGSMRVDLALSDLLDAGGAPRTDALPTLRGEARIEDLRTATLDALLAPVLGPSGLELAEDIGPTATVLLVGSPAPEVGPDASTLDLTFRSSKVDITAPLTVTPNRIASRQPITIVDRAAGGTVSRVLAETLRTAPSGVARVTIADLDAPIGEGFVPRPDRVRATVTATMTDFAADVDLQRPGAPLVLPPQRIEAKRLVASLAAVPGSPPRVTLEGDLVHDESPFTVSAEATLRGLFRAEPTDAAAPFSVLSPADMRPEGTFAIRSVPASLARVLPADLVQIGEQRVDVVLAARDLLGRAFDAAVTSAPVADSPGVTQITLELRGENLRGDGRVKIGPRSMRLAESAATVTLTPRLAEHLLAVATPDAPVKPGLRGPARATLTLLEPIDAPLTEGFMPDLANAPGALRARLVLDAALAALTFPGEGDAPPMTIPPVAIERMTLEATAPVAALAGGDGAASVTLAGAIKQQDGSVLANLQGGADATLKAGAPEGAMPVTLTLTEVSAQWIDQILEQPALVAGAIGDRFALTVTADPDRYQRRDASQAAVTIAVDAPRFKTKTPVGLAFNKEAIFIREALDATWTIGPAWGNHFLFGATSQGPAPTLTLTDPTPVSIRVQRLALSLREGDGLFKPGVFLIDSTATIPEAQANMRDGRRFLARRVEARLGRGPTPDQIGFSLEMGGIKVGDGPLVEPRESAIRGRLATFTDAAGNLALEGARINLSGGLAPIPTAVIDALAQQNGLLVDALGATADFTIDADDLSAEGGTLRATMITPLARAEIRGRAGNGLLIIDPSSTVQIFEIRPDLTRRLQKALPMIASLEKTTEDRPARVIFDTPVALPLDGTFDRLNGQFTIDIGTARFGTSDLFSKILSFAQQKTAGQVGKRLPPLKITMADGLVSYDRYGLPFGEFTLESQGFINLASQPRRIRESGGDALAPRHLEVLTFVPAGAFVAEAVPSALQFNLARLPVRTRGSIASPKTEVAAELLGKEAVNELLAPGRLLDQGAKDLLDDLLRGGKPKKP